MAELLGGDPDRQLLWARRLHGLQAVSWLAGFVIVVLLDRTPERWASMGMVGGVAVLHATAALRLATDRPRSWALAVCAAGLSLFCLTLPLGAASILLLFQPGVKAAAIGGHFREPAD